MGRTVDFAAAATDAGIAVQQLFPGELLNLGHAELLDGFVLHVQRRQRRTGLVLGQHLVQRPGEDVEELRIGNIGDETEAEQQMHPPGHDVGRAQSRFAYAGEQQRN